MSTRSLPALSRLVCIYLLAAHVLSSRDEAVADLPTDSQIRSAAEQQLAQAAEADFVSIFAISDHL